MVTKRGWNEDRNKRICQKSLCKAEKKKQVRTYEGEVLLVLIEALVHCDTIKSRRDGYLINANVLNWWLICKNVT